jgi:hypothetical protein
MTQFEKDPDSKLDYSFDWTEWLDQEDEIVLSSWSVERENEFSVDTDQGLSVSDNPAPATNEENTKTSVWLEEGKERRRYIVTNRIETKEDRVAERSFQIYVEDQ